jgi:hypothetical protein
MLQWGVGCRCRERSRLSVVLCGVQESIHECKEAGMTGSKKEAQPLLLGNRPCVGALRDVPTGPFGQADDRFEFWNCSVQLQRNDLGCGLEVKGQGLRQVLIAGLMMHSLASTKSS